MIPKIIHYCWFGGNPLPPLAQKCIASWKKYLPDYEIKEWNESNFDVNIIPYTEEAYKAKKYAFVSDYARFYILYKYGGLYFDTDVEVIKSFDDLLKYDAFFGFEDNKYIATGLGFGSEKNGNLVNYMIKEYDKFLDGTHEVVTCPKLNTYAVEKFGFNSNGEYQLKDNTVLLPKEFLNPFNNNTGVMNKTDKTHSIHWYSMSWLSPARKIKSKITRPLHRIFGESFFEKIKGK